ncbi:VOC family protein [Pendulispora rubella]|uniref:VOC family protein n=1 Tax=Pendulispora rubella TaxID=2741070 RepID=A0ABZ2LI25_9BACT
MIALDHLVVGARTLEEGAQWVFARLGVMPAGGGKHPLMGTHNRVLRLGDATYLEVIAVDPEAAAPSRARWFGLDSPEVRARLERGPSLLHWVARTDDIERDATAAPVHMGAILEASRGDLRWRITVPREGTLPRDGIFPTFIQWDGPHPATAMPESNCQLESLQLSHPRGGALLAALRHLGLPSDAPVTTTDGDPQLLARIRVGDDLIALP